MIAQFKISGKITNSIDNLPLSGAHIVVQKTKLSTISSEKGYYEINGLKSGNYNLKVSFLGMETKTIKVNLEKDFVLNISILMNYLLYTTDTNKIQG